MSQIIETALSVEAEDRFLSAQDMHLALERFQAAMTHYAGQAALAQYIKDLVEGRVENPVVTPGGVVEPAMGGGSGSPSPRPSSGGLEGARAYEEVFGVGLESERPRPKVRSVPSSWETKPKRSAPANRQVEGQQRLIDLRSTESADDVPELMQVTSPRATPTAGRTPSMRPVAAPRSGPSKLSIFLLLLVFSLAAGAFGAYLYRDKIGQLIPATVPPPPTQTSVYRIESNPAGAEVFLDGVPVQGVTPVEVELIPGITYEVVVRRNGHATKVAEVKAAVGTEIRRLPFRLEPSGVLTVYTEPPGATVKIENRIVRDRVTPMTLRDVPANRQITVTVRMPGMPSRTRQVLLRPGKRRSVTINLEEG